jgi:hypothetical protein
LHGFLRAPSLRPRELSVCDGADRTDTVSGLKDVPLLGDLEPDNREELVIWRPFRTRLGGADARWYGLNMTSPDPTQFFAPGSEPLWGLPGDYPLLGDLNGDGTDELIVYRPSEGRWYVRRVDGTRYYPAGSEPVWGVGTDVPLVADLDGNGADELIVWRPGNGRWYALRADKTRFFQTGSEPQLGGTGDVPLVGDLTGEYIDEMIVWSPSTGKWSAIGANGVNSFRWAASRSGVFWATSRSSAI